MSHLNSPLTNEQKVLGSGQVLPSGESNFYDFSQDHSYNDGSGINANFPNPPDFNHASGTIRTYGAEDNIVETSGVFSASGLNIPFSNASTAGVSGITDFTIWNDYIHNQLSGITTTPNEDFHTIVQIPFLSTYKVSEGFNPYEF